MRTIVVDIEQPGDPDQAALAAASACVGPDIRVHLFHNLFHRNIINDDGQEDQVLNEARELLMESRQRQLDQLGQRYFGEQADSSVVWSELGWQELVRFAVSHRSDLVVVHSHQQSRWKRLTLSNDDWELIRHCPLPLLLTRPDSPKHYRRIVAAVDPLHADDKPAELDRQILQVAAEFARHHQSKMSVLNIVALSMAVPPAALEPIAPSVAAGPELVKSHRQKVDELTAEINYELTDSKITCGVPGDEIVQYVADQQADLLVMGAVSRKRLSRLLIGNTAERVLDAVPCDVLIVKPSTFDSRLPAVAALMGSFPHPF